MLLERAVTLTTTISPKPTGSAIAVAALQQKVLKYMTEDNELLPCPFCGGEAERADLEDEDNFGGSVIQCKKCQASSAVHFDRKEHLYSSWNERSPKLQVMG